MICLKCDKKMAIDRLEQEMTSSRELLEYKVQRLEAETKSLKSDLLLAQVTGSNEWVIL